MTDERWIDPEIDRLFDGDAELSDLAQRIRAARPEPPIDPRFRTVLRARLMREAESVLRAPVRPAARPRTARIRRRWSRPSRVAWGGLGFAAALAAAAVLTIVRTPLQDHQVTAMSPVASLHAVSPDNVITVSFSEPMNRRAVVAGLHIQPATTVTTAWRGNTLVITPTHHLVGNTPYSVTIDHGATRSATGQLAASAIHIAFATAPTPAPVPVVASLMPSVLGGVNAGSQLIPADGGVVATDAAPAPTAPATASPAAAAPSSASTHEMLLIAAGRAPVDLGPAPAAAALAPNGLRLVTATPVASGTVVAVVPVDGSARTVLATLATQVLAVGWESNGTALVAETDRIVSVDLLGHVGPVASLPAGTSSVTFAPGGAAAFAGAASADGSLIDLRSGNQRALTSSRRVAAFSGDGSTVAWVDASGAAPQILSSRVARDTTTATPLPDGGDVAALALDAAGSHAAVALSRPGAGGLVVVALPSGAEVARGPSATAPAYAASGDRLVFVAGGEAQVATVPGATPGETQALPAAAAAALKGFVDAQVRGDGAAIDALSTPGSGAGAATPPGLSRGYVISAAANADGSVSATARLIADPTATRAAASFLDETITLTPSGGGVDLVTAVSAGPLTRESVGPHVVSVTPVSARSLTLQVSFDSDLRAQTVPAAITVTSAAGVALASSTTYDASTRTATVTLAVPASTAVVLQVDTTLVDVDGQSLATLFTTAAGG